MTFDKTTAAAFRAMAPDIPLTILEDQGGLSSSIKSYIAQRRRDLPPHAFLSLVIPELLQSRGLWEILRRPSIHRLKASFLSHPDVQIIDVPVVREDIDPTWNETREPARHYVIVLVAGVHNASLQAIEYAETLSPHDLRAVSFGLDPAATDELAADWLGYGVPVPLELEDSPYRDIGRSLATYIQRFRPDGKDRMVTVVIPEFIVSKLRHHALHGQTALLVKRSLLFERGVAVASVPYHLED